MKNNLLFDFDGVIADTFDFCYRLHRLINPQNSIDDYRQKFEGNIYESLSATRSRDFLRDNTHYFHVYKTELMKRNSIDDMGDAINNLAADYALYIVSSSHTDIIKEFLVKENLLGQFREILGADVDHSKANKIQMLEEEYRIGKNNALFITDTLGDIREAAKREIRSVAVSWGFHPAETLVKGEPVAIVDTPLELVETVRMKLK